MYNRLGNFNRIIGDSLNAIECFRKALQLEPHNSDVLINLARLLFKLKFYDDAIILTRKSIEYIRHGRLPWFQHFTLAEIYKLNGFDKEAFTHVKYALKLKPGHENSMKLATELASKNIIENSQFFYLFRFFEAIFTILMDSAPSFYLQLFFHVFILVFLVIFGIIYSFLNILFDDREVTNILFKNKSIRSSITKLGVSSTQSAYDSSILANDVKSYKKLCRLHMRLKKSSIQGN
jgi:tetratricopeptide (TPR) repeat protein